MAAAPFSARLDIVLNHGLVFAELTYTNVSDGPAFLLSYNAALDDELEGDLFRITDERGKQIPYVGMLAKRKPRPEDFRRLEPNQQLTSRVRLDDVYEFPADGPHEFKVVLSAFQQHPELPDVWKLTSNEAQFRQ